MCALFGNSIYYGLQLFRSLPAVALNFEGFFYLVQIAEIHSFHFNKLLFMNRLQTDLLDVFGA